MELQKSLTKNCFQYSSIYCKKQASICYRLCSISLQTMAGLVESHCTFPGLKQIKKQPF